MLIPALVAWLDAHAAELAFREADGRLRMALSSDLHAFGGEARRFSGTFSTDALTGEVVVPVEALTTGLGPRDSRMRQWCLEVARFPDVRFEVARVRGGVDGLRAGAGAGTAVFTGPLTIRDVTREVEVPVTWSWEGGNLRIRGRLDLDWTSWNVPDPAVVIATLAPAMSVEFDVIARPS